MNEKTRIVLDRSWILAGPAILYFMGVLGAPLLAPSIGGAGQWLLAFAFLVQFFLSALAHLGAHLAAARLLGLPLPGRIYLFFLGDTAQSWPPAKEKNRAPLAVAAGPVANIILASLGAGLLGFISNKFLFALAAALFLENCFMAWANFFPGFPLDGGRFNLPFFQLFAKGSGTYRRALKMGWALASIMALWGFYIMSRHVRFGLEAGLGAVLFAILLVMASLSTPYENRAVPESAPVIPEGKIRRFFFVLDGFLLLALQLILFVSILPLPVGLMAPQPCIEAGRMVEIPPRKYMGAGGRFLITTVFTQAPIFLGQYLYAGLDESLRIVPPEIVIPAGMSPQEEMKQAANDLSESGLYARVAAFRLAGYPVAMRGDGVEVNSVLEESPSRGKLVPGDVIVRFNGILVGTMGELVGLIRKQDPRGRVEVEVLRGGQRKAFKLSFMPPRAGLPTRLGISIKTRNLRADFPFEVSIRTGRIMGGPSAGLILALAIYSRISPGNLAKGRIVAGTGALDPEGRVLEIGAVECKVAAAEQAGADIFLCPAENGGAAVRAAEKIRVVPVRTVREAVDYLRKLPPLKKNGKGDQAAQ